jgi:membrane protein DedA with SNARE-associated domain
MKMTIMKAFVVLMLSLSAATVFAQKEVVMTGAGTMSCKKYMDTMQSLSSSDKEIIAGMFEGWIQGYLSGRNRQLDVLSYKSVDIGNVEQLGAMLTFACGNAVKQGLGTTPLFIVVDKVFEEEFDKKIKKK